MRKLIFLRPVCYLDSYSFLHIWETSGDSVQILEGPRWLTFNGWQASRQLVGDERRLATTSINAADLSVAKPTWSSYKVVERLLARWEQDLWIEIRFQLEP